MSFFRVSDEWSLGSSMCQLQAFAEITLRNSFIWYLSLLSIERYTKHIMPHDYLVTFSPLTINVILPGLMLIIIIQVTGPLYGWGKYEYIQDYGLCGVSTTSNFGCSYAIYLFICLILPPVSVIIMNGLLLSSRKCKRSRTIVAPKRNISSGNSNILSADKEIVSLVIFMSLVIIFSLPRSIVDACIMCENMENISPGAIFSVYFLDSLLNILLPIICLSMHPNARVLLWRTLARTNSVSSDIDMSSLNL
ncbi:trace amine-associated receptor 6 [Nephila pilipes]|uniref:Trace amine-associated receptor 6 n=1 Tax=Nephila pilipes TaxID=299642 RepID=A0A8X6PEA2_NEPPI|nr:trace amine-associated receptor 6 [Nephila pilipes]